MRKNAVKHSMRTLALVAMLLAVCMIAGGLSGSQTSMAAENYIGTVNGEYYTDFGDLVDDVESRGGSNFTIAMLSDWKAGDNSDFDQRLIIPKNSRVTLNMHGHVFDRSNVHYDGWTSNGELICVESGASLTINGGSEKTKHRHNIFTSLDREAYANQPADFEGGLLTGGSSTNGGGGIHIKADATVTLNDLTIAGCRAQQRSGTDGFGGGISIAGSGTTLKLNDSTITGCYAYNDGGGIHIDNDNNVRIEMVNSHVDANYSGSDAGGIDVEGESIVIKGDENSTISRNMCKMYGGGVYLWNDEQTLTGTGNGLTIEGNHAREGGGIYTQEETISLTSLNIVNNEVDFWTVGYGGGVYVNNDNTVILNCRITGNKANIGGGVYTNVDEDPVDTGFFVNGTTVIKDNIGREGCNNLTLVNGNNRVRFGLTSGADVHMGYQRYPAWYSSVKYYQVTDGKAGDTIKASNCLRYLTPDDTGHHFTFNDAPNYRKIFYVADGIKDDSIVGKSYTKATKEKVSVNDAAPKVVGRTDAGGDKVSGGAYDLIRGFYRHEKTDSGTVDRDAVFYYSDGLFYGDPYEFNDHLATASWILNFAGSYLREGGGDPASYKYKHTCGRQFLADIGCPDQNIYVNDTMFQKPGLDTIGVTIASKNLQSYVGTGSKPQDTGDILIPVTIRGGGYESEWASNTTLGKGTERDGEAQGFSEAADQVMSEIDHYIAKYGLEDKLANGEVKFWVTGFSRAGATANLTSKRLIEKYADGTEGKNNQVFAYPCEAPKGGTDAAEKLDDKTKYYCIHNIINDGDMVPLVAPGEMGFKRYGVDHYIPGTAAGEVKKTEGKANEANGGIPVTTYADNQPLKTKTAEYEAEKAKMLTNLKSVDSEIIFDDYFHPMAMDFFPGTSVYESGEYDGTHVEDFLKDFFAILQDAPGDDASQKEARTAVRSRQQYASEAVVINDVAYNTIQQAGRDTMSLVFSLSEEDSASFAERAGNIMNSISMISMNPFSSDITMVTIWRKVIGNWTDRTGPEKITYINFFKDALAKTKAFDYLPPEDLTRLEKNWPTLADMIFRFVEADYRFYPGSNGKAWAGGSSKKMMYTPTFMTFSGYILKNHAPEVGISWARVRDDYYGGEADLKEYTIEPGIYTPSAPSAKAGKTELKEVEPVALSGDQKIVLDTEDIKGEAIYYTLSAKDGDEDVELAKEQLYRGGIDIEAGTRKAEYTLTAYARSFSKNSQEKTYSFSVTSDRHEVSVTYGGGAQQILEYKEGDTVIAIGEDNDNQFFSRWRILDGEGTDVTEYLLPTKESRTAPKMQFVMPDAGAESGDYKWEPGYRLRVIGVYNTKIDSVTVSLVPQAGEPLPAQATVSWKERTESGTETKTAAVPVAWTYKDTAEDGKEYEYADMGNAYDETAYTAQFQLDLEDTEGWPFAAEVTAQIEEQYKEKVDGISLKKSAADGSVSVLINYKATDDSGSNPRPEATVPCKLQIETYDVDTEGEADPEIQPVYTVIPGRTAAITAPEVQDMAFMGWEIPTGAMYSLAEGSAAEDRTISLDIAGADTVADQQIRAKYRPVLNKVEISMDALEGGKPLPAIDEEHGLFVIRITNEYEVDPANIAIDWSPESQDKKTGYLTPYTAVIHVVPKDGKIGIREKGSTGEYIQRGAQFVAAESPEVTVNGKKTSYDADSMTVTYTFDAVKYNLKSVRQPAAISGVARGTDLSPLVPDSTTIVRDDGAEVKAPISWITHEAEGDDPLGEKVWTYTGEVLLPTGVENRDKLSLEVSMTITVREADTVSAPKASLESGSYLADQAITLSTTTEDAEIYYSVNDSDSKKYEGETIAINRADAPVTVKAVAKKPGMRDSAQAVYQYEFTNELAVPEERLLMYTCIEDEPVELVGVPSSAFYTLEAAEDSGVTINKNGEATAKDPGTYTVTARIAEGFQWLLPDETTTTEDQTISFTIGEGSILAGDSYDTVSQLKEELKVMIGDREVPADDYSISYSDVVNGQVTVNVAMKGANNGQTLSKVVDVSAIDQMGEDGTAFGKGASAGAANHALINMKSNKDPKGTRFSPLMLKSTKQGKTSVKLTWKKTGGAVRYVVYGAQTGKAYKRLAAVSGKTYNVKKIDKKLKKKTYHKFIVVALDKNGNVVTTSKVAHVATKGNLKKAANPKKVVVKAKVNKKGKKLKKYKKTSAIGVKVGKKTKLKASYTKARKSKVKKKAAMRYESSNAAIATVTAKGVVKGVKKGKAKIYVYAQNGVCKTVKVTVR